MWQWWLIIDVAMLLNSHDGHCHIYCHILPCHQLAGQSHDFPLPAKPCQSRLCCTAARRWAFVWDATEIHGLINVDHQFPIRTGWWRLEPWNFDWLSICWEWDNDPNWQSHIFFQRGRYTTNQMTCGYGWHWRRRASTLGDVEGWTSIWPIKTSYCGYQGMGSDPYPC